MYSCSFVKLCCSPPFLQLLKLYQESKCNAIMRRPLYRVPVPEVERNGQAMPEKMFLCYDVRGWTNQAFNLISDTCVSVNALYSTRSNTSEAIITKIGILSKDSAGHCQHTAVDLMKGCAVSVNGKAVGSDYKPDNIEIHMNRHGNSRVHIAVPNCNKSDAVMMWVYCQRKNGRPMMPFEISQSTTHLGNTAHGLVGMCVQHSSYIQYWIAPATYSNAVCQCM